MFSWLASRDCTGVSSPQRSNILFLQRNAANVDFSRPLYEGGAVGNETCSSSTLLFFHEGTKAPTTTTPSVTHTLPLPMLSPQAACDPFSLC